MELTNNYSLYELCKEVKTISSYGSVAFLGLGVLANTLTGMSMFSPQECYLGSLALAMISASAKDAVNTMKPVIDLDKEAVQEYLKSLYD
jgi:hypothetical protein